MNPRITPAERADNMSVTTDPFPPMHEDDHPLTQAFAERRGGIKIIPAATVIPIVEVEK